MGLSDYYEDREYQFEAKISELEKQLAEALAENAALVAEFQRLADEPPTLEEIAADLDKIEMLEKELAEARAEIKSLKDDKHTNLKEILQLRHDVAEARAEVEHWKGECSDLVRMAHEMRAEIDYFQTLIDLQHKRTMEANKLWQQAHNQPDVLPDLGKLVEWLLLRLQNQETIIEANRATVKAKDALIEALRTGKMSPCDYYTSKESEENLCRELAEARAEIDKLNAIADMQRARLGKREEAIAERDRLIEQMRDALKALKQQHYVNDDDNWYSCPASGLCSNDHAGTDCNCSADHVNHIIDAALSAAERINK